MIDLRSICDEMNEDAESVISWCDQLYSDNFESYFKDEKDLFKRLESKIHPITDEELEWILTTLPLELFSVSEKLSKIKITQEVYKMKNKQKNSELVDKSLEKTQTKKKEEADLQMLENKLVETVYSSIISRVENEISFSRELIMSAKKIWDRRRQIESSNPIGNFDPSQHQQYIKGQEHKTFYEQQQEAKKSLY